MCWEGKESNVSVQGGGWSSGVGAIVHIVLSSRLLKGFGAMSVADQQECCVMFDEDAFAQGKEDVVATCPLGCSRQRRFDNKL